MNVVHTTIVALALFLAVPNLGLCQDLMVYPAQGQTPEQTEKDKFECYNWAKQQSGFDPMQIPTATTAPPSTQAQSGGVAKGALRGGAAGTVIGAATGGSKNDLRRSARIGIVGGAVAGGVRRSSANKQKEAERQQWEQQESDKYFNQRNNYNRAYGACLEGKGYTVK